jgi:tetratricopeptide (TPR) repeat protein
LPQSEVDLLILIEVSAVALWSDVVMPGRNIAVEDAAIGDRSDIAAVPSIFARLRLSEGSHEALKGYSRGRVPLLWAMAQNNLGLALTSLGNKVADRRLDGTHYRQEAVAALRDALEERTRERVPLDWAATQNNLGNVLANLGLRDSGTAYLEEAIAAYESALTVRTRERVPPDWAMSTANQGVVFMLAVTPDRKRHLDLLNRGLARGFLRRNVGTGARPVRALEARVTRASFEQATPELAEMFPILESGGETAPHHDHVGKRLSDAIGLAARHLIRLKPSAPNGAISPWTRWEPATRR